MRIQSLHDLHFSFPDTDGYWNVEDLAMTESKIRLQIPKINETPQPKQIEAMTQLARLFCLQGKLKEARDFLVFAETLLKDLSEKERTRPQVRYYLEEGRFYCLSMYPSRALDSFQKAFEISSESSELEIFAVDSAYMMSITLPAKQGSKWLQIAIEIAQKTKDSHGRQWQTFLYMADGWKAFDHHNYEKALSLFERAQSFSNDETPAVNRTIKWCTARCLRALNQIEKSLDFQMQISRELSQAGESNGYVLLEMAECYQILQKTEEARAYFQLAYDKLKIDKWFFDNCGADLSRMQKLIKKHPH